jgi:hypothetical protein
VSVVDFPERRPRDPIAVRGVGRDAEDDRFVVVAFWRRLTDEELRFFHDVCDRSASLIPAVRP